LTGPSAGSNSDVGTGYVGLGASNFIKKTDARDRRGLEVRGNIDSAGVVVKLYSTSKTGVKEKLRESEWISGIERDY
jgi:hypothetical protein